ncbi:MAG TPA: choice-of-anchor B family protein [Ignavibacteria bacterium]|nr:choice-of-anchor B family protein [Ignavibacteria bacterium]HMR40147.1 choice-of-anchor B family protein [Ignavibacteria bacterium]
MKKLFLLLIIALCLSNNSNAQLPNQNTYLIKQLDAHGTDYSALWGYLAPDGREYAILGCYTGTAFIDVTDSANVHEVDFVNGVSSQWREMKVYDHYAYIVSEGTNSRLQIIDLQYLPDSVSLVNTWSYSGYTKTHSISQSGPYLYLNGGNSAGNGGITIVDITNPVSPVKRGQWTNLYVHDSRILNDTIWASNVYSGQTSIINAANKNSPVTVKTFQSYPVSTISTHNCAITDDRKYLLTTNEVSSPNGKLNVWNIEDLDNISFVTEWQPTGITTAIVHNVEIYGNYAVIAHYRAGIRIVDISNPVVPVEVAWYDTYPSSNSAAFTGCWAVYKFPSGKIIGSDITGGLFVIKTTVAGFNPQPIKVNMKVFTEGLYNVNTNRLNRKDTVTVYLRNNTSPYAIVDSAKTGIDSINFSGLLTFPDAPAGVYYMDVKYFNGIRTWSKNGGEILNTNGITYNYDFSSMASQAYGNNLILKGSKYCTYSGDLNQNGVVTLDDVLGINNDANIFASGIRLLSDLNADGTVELSDITIAYNNSINFVEVVTP